MTSEKEVADLKTYLGKLADLEGSDLYLTVGAVPVAKVADKLVPLSELTLTPSDMERLTASFFTSRRMEEFDKKPELDVAESVPGKGRFRINIYRQRGSLGLAARRIKFGIPTFDDLGLPQVLKKLAEMRQGLLCVTGATSSGKSSTLAAMVDHRNSTLPGHILTIEDPIEFFHEHKASVVSQREVGSDTASYADALKSALRQAPDLLLIGEIRDKETTEAALHFAETGHLVFATVHATNASQTVDRLVHMFPPEQFEQACLLLSLNLGGVITQRLVPTKDGDGRVAAIEILVPTARIRDLIKEGDMDAVFEAMREMSGTEGIQTFDDALHKLASDKQITEEQAIAYSDVPNDLRIRFRVDKGDEGKEVEKIRLAKD
ncbi:PilT/PilU family type 4a pilus ATPase [Planctomycetota bacterium]